MNGVLGLNHLTLAVSDIDRSTAFYTGLLGFSVRWKGASSAYLEAGTLWLALVFDTGVRSEPLPEYTHVAFTVSEDNLPGMIEKLTNAGVRCWQKSHRNDSFYFLDPDGHKLELHSGDLCSRIREREASQEAPSAGPT